MHFTDTDTYNRLLSKILGRVTKIENGGRTCLPGHNSVNNFAGLFPNARDSSLNSRIEPSLQSIESVGLITVYKPTVVENVINNTIRI